MKFTHKISLSITVLCLLLVIFTACANRIDGSAENTQTAGENETTAAVGSSKEPVSLDAIIYQPDRTDLPALKDFDAVVLNQTTVAQMLELFGMPQASETSGLCSVSYGTSDGYWVRLYLIQRIGDYPSPDATMQLGEFFVYDKAVYRIEQQPDGSEKLVEEIPW